MSKSSKGITLVSLVITIIVLLILAGVTISIAINSGIMDKTQNAVDRYTEQQKNESNKLDIIDDKMGNLMNRYDPAHNTL